MHINNGNECPLSLQGKKAPNNEIWLPPVVAVHIACIWGFRSSYHDLNIWLATIQNPLNLEVFIFIVKLCSTAWVTGAFCLLGPIYIPLIQWLGLSNHCDFWKITYSWWLTTVWEDRLTGWWRSTYLYWELRKDGSHPTLVFVGFDMWECTWFCAHWQLIHWQK